METADTAPPKLPTWAKSLLALFFAGLAALVAGISYLGYMAGEISNPAYIDSVMREMVSIDSLPQGFKYDKGMRLPGMQMVVLTHEKGTIFNLSKVPNAQDLPAKNFVDKIKTSAAVGGRIKISSEGVRQVAGKDFYYAVGALLPGDSSDPKLALIQGEQLRGALALPDKKVLMLVGTTPGAAYDMDNTNKFLDSIKGFAETH